MLSICFFSQHVCLSVLMSFMLIKKVYCQWHDREGLWGTNAPPPLFAKRVLEISLKSMRK